MAIHVLSILKALAPLIADAGSMVAGIRSTGTAKKVEERVEKLERETLRAGEVITGLAEQLQALAQLVRMQADQVEALQRRIRVMMILSIGALGAGAAALAVALLH